MSDIKFDIFCDHCNKNEHVVFDPKSKFYHSENLPLGKISDIQYFSIDHIDHTVTVAVDIQKQKMRSINIIDQIGSKHDQLYAPIVSKILDMLEANPDVKYSLLFISNNQEVNKILISLFPSLLVNTLDKPHLSCLLSVSSQNTLFEVGNMAIYWGDKTDNVKHFITEDTIIIYEMRQDNMAEITSGMIDDLDYLSDLNFTIFINTEEYSTDEIKNRMNELVEIVPKFSIFDVRDVHSTLIAIENTLDNIARYKVYTSRN